MEIANFHPYQITKEAMREKNTSPSTFLTDASKRNQPEKDHRPATIIMGETNDTNDSERLRPACKV
jgi:hypothetical protein